MVRPGWTLDDDALSADKLRVDTLDDDALSADKLRVDALDDDALSADKLRVDTLSASSTPSNHRNDSRDGLESIEQPTTATAVHHARAAD